MFYPFEEEIKRWENRLVKTCEVCNGTGAIPGTNGISKMCNCKETAILYSHLISRGVPRKYINWKWIGCNIDPTLIKKCEDYSKNFIKNYLDGKGLFLYGKQGIGKTTLSSIICKDVAMKINPDTDKHFNIIFMMYEELVQLSYNQKDKIYSICKMADLLVIDNIGSETGLTSEKKHTTKLLDEILRHRSNGCVPTIISSNFTPDELATYYSDTVSDFIHQNCNLICIDGDNFREKDQMINNLIDDFDGGVDFDE